MSDLHGTTYLDATFHATALTPHTGLLPRSHTYRRHNKPTGCTVAVVDF
jgi:hypothetical protein